MSSGIFGYKRALSIIFGEMACYTISLAVLVFVVKLLLYLMISHILSNRYLNVVANAEESSHYPIQAGVPQGAIWSPILFNLYVWQLPLQVHYCHIVSYADDSTLLVVLSKEARDFTARGINSNLDALVCWGKKWRIEFEPAKSSALCILLKRNLQDHPSLVMDSIPIVRHCLCWGSVLIVA